MEMGLAWAEEGWPRGAGDGSGLFAGLNWTIGPARLWPVFRCGCYLVLVWFLLVTFFILVWKILGLQMGEIERLTFIWGYHRRPLKLIKQNDQKSSIVPQHHNTRF